MNVPPENAAKFYRGFDLGWYSIKDNLDVRRTLANEIIREQIIPSPVAERPKLVVLKGHAGSGKSVMLRRIAWDAAQLHGRLCFFVSRQGLIDIQFFEEIFSLTNLPIFLFIDNVAEHKGKLFELFRSITRSRAAVQIICAESFVLWNALCDDLESHVSAEYEMRYLGEGEIEELLDKLHLHKSLGYLAGLSSEKRKSELRFVHGRHLTEEYKSIPSNDARRLYLDICCLHRFGPPVRAGLISRLHDISFEDFKERMFRPLEQVIRLRQDAKSGDYVYESRHSHIAHELYQAILVSQEERYDNLVRIIRKLNPSYSYDLEVLGRLVRAENIRSAINDPIRGLQIYEIAIQSAGRRPVILHQRGIYELGNASNRTELDRAEDSLAEALSMEPYNRSFKHSLAELALRRSRVSNDPMERQTWRQTAIERASALTGGDSSPYPHHTILKAVIDEVRDALGASELAGTEASMLHLGEAITKAEDALRKGLQQFPNDPALLGEEGELSNVLSQAPRAELAFERAFQSNPKSTLLARRLSRIQRAKADFSGALNTLRTALESNPSNRELHYDVAMVLLESEPSADQEYSDDILYHLRRAFSPGDRNYSAQFFYARQLCVSGKYEDARPLFAALSEARIPFSEKTRIQGVLRDKKGDPKIFNGTIVAILPTFAFVESEDPKMRVFVQLNEIEETEMKDFIIGFPVSFELAFNMRGPLARNLRLIVS
jgi:cold shock CspA family protein